MADDQEKRRRLIMAMAQDLGGHKGNLEPASPGADEEHFDEINWPKKGRSNLTPYGPTDLMSEKDRPGLESQWMKSQSSDAPLEDTLQADDIISLLAIPAVGGAALLRKMAMAEADRLASGAASKGLSSTMTMLSDEIKKNSPKYLKQSAAGKKAADTKYLRYSNSMRGVPGNTRDTVIDAGQEKTILDPYRSITPRLDHEEFEGGRTDLGYSDRFKKDMRNAREEWLAKQDAQRAAREFANAPSPQQSYEGKWDDVFRNVGEEPPPREIKQSSWLGSGPPEPRSEDKEFEDFVNGYEAYKKRIADFRKDWGETDSNFVSHVPQKLDDPVGPDGLYPMPPPGPKSLELMMAEDAIDRGILHSPTGNKEKDALDWLAMARPGEKAMRAVNPPDLPMSSPMPTRKYGDVFTDMLNLYGTPAMHEAFQRANAGGFGGSGRKARGMSMEAGKGKWMEEVLKRMEMDAKIDNGFFKQKTVAPPSRKKKP